MSELIVGIDLGTTNSEVAVHEDGGVRVLACAEKRRILPSLVGVADDGTLLVGEPARNQALLHPERTIRSVKRRMGESGPLMMAGKAYSPQEISAIILRRLKEIAEQDLGQPVHKAVITVPAYFSDAQRQATREAGEIAGFTVARIINEPTAAALAYNAGCPQGKVLLVYDLGGGTFDVSVVRIEQEVVEVLATHGDNHLGGDDFDDLMVAWLTTHLQDTHGVDAKTSPQAMARIRRAAEAAKRHLSDHPFATIAEEFLLTRGKTPVHLSVELSRERYEEMIAPLIDRTMASIHTALSGAGMTASQVEEILLVGGSSRTPLVGRRLQEEFGRMPRGEVDPELCVAMGAAIQAGVLGGRAVSAVLVDVTPYTFGTSALSYLDGFPYPYTFIPIIPKNTPIPVSRSEVFTTVEHEQEAVDVRIFQGEERDALKNVEIGKFMVEGLSAVPAGNLIVLNLDLDADGILHVSAVEKATGLAKHISIENAASRLQGAEMASAQGRVNAFFGQDETEGSDPHWGREAVKARALVEKAEGMLDKAEAEDRVEMIDLIESIRDALTAEDADALEEPMEQLADILFYLET